MCSSDLRAAEADATTLRRRAADGAAWSARLDAAEIAMAGEVMCAELAGLGARLLDRLGCGARSGGGVWRGGGCCSRSGGCGGGHCHTGGLVIWLSLVAPTRSRTCHALTLILVAPA